MVTGGFERNGFSQRTEQAFDQTFGYARQLTESFRFLHGMKHGDEATKAEWQRQATAAAADRQQRTQRHEPAQTTRTHVPTPKMPEIDVTDDLWAMLGQALRQRDTQQLSAALATAQAERDRQEQAKEQKAELARKQAVEASRLAEQEKATKEEKTQQQALKRPKINRGLSR